MSLSPPTSVPRAGAPARESDLRFVLVWAVLLGCLAVGWAARDACTRAGWIAVLALLWLGPIKAVALLGLTRQERGEWTAGRLTAYLLWVGAQPRMFLPSYTPPPSTPVPTWRGFLLNVLAGAALLGAVPLLLPPATPLLVRAWLALVGLALLRLFAGFDFLALLFRRVGWTVDKAFHNPLAATSVRDFWGRRWNRLMSGMLRELLFRPLARRAGVVAAAAAVFLYSGVVHEFVSLLAGRGYGGPTLYFVLQGLAFLAEGTRPGRWLTAHRVVGWCWTALVVVGPVTLILPPSFLYDVVVPAMREMGVPGMPP
jgi:alginate O-acetyltransferase complex protein AlgI